MDLLIQFLIGVILAIFIAWLAYKVESLNKSGAIAAAILGAIVFGLGGISWAAVLMGFFVSSSVLSRFFERKKSNLTEKFSKGSRRDAGQVIANGSVAGLMVILHFIIPNSHWTWFAFSASMAAVNADTWATELGVLSRRRPRLITSWKKVERGASGGVSLEGSLASALGSFFIAILALIFMPEDIYTIGISSALLNGLVTVFWMTLAGFAGSLFDSLIGATVQGLFFCDKCKKETEKSPRHNCGAPTRLIRGFSWLNNDVVNISCSIFAVFFFLIILWPFPARPILSDIYSSENQGGSSMANFTLSTLAFTQNGNIPKKYTCDGENISPSFSITGVPPMTRSLALIVEDPDAPMGIFTHWILYNIPSTQTSLQEGLPKTGSITGVGNQGSNDMRRVGYDGPCPPRGAAHRYFFRLFALDLEPRLPSGLGAPQLQKQIKDHIIGEAVWIGLYHR